MYPKKERMMSGSPTHAIPLPLLKLFGHIVQKIEGSDDEGDAKPSGHAAKSNGFGLISSMPKTPSATAAHDEVLSLERAYNLSGEDWARVEEFSLCLAALLQARRDNGTKNARSFAVIPTPVMGSTACSGGRGIIIQPKVTPVSEMSKAIAVPARMAVHSSKTPSHLPPQGETPATVPYGEETSRAAFAPPSGVTVGSLESSTRYPPRIRSKSRQPSTRPVEQAPPPSPSPLARAEAQAVGHSAAASGEGIQADGASAMRLPSGDHKYTTRTSVGGRNYTDEQLKQLNLIEAEVVAHATPSDQRAFSLPRQGRTLTLSNIFKFIAIKGSGHMHSLAERKGVPTRTGKHSNFYDGKIDSRIVNIVRRDIGDESITRSRKFSKVLLSLVAEGCAADDPECDWDYSTFTSENIACLQHECESAHSGSGTAPHKQQTQMQQPQGRSGRRLNLSNNFEESAGFQGNDKRKGGHEGLQHQQQLGAHGPPQKRFKQLANGDANRAAAMTAPQVKEEAMRAAELLHSFKGGGSASNSPEPFHS